MFVCPHYKDIRTKYVTKQIFGAPDRDNFINCVKNSNEDLIRNAYYFWCEAVKIREFFMEDMY